MSGWRWLGLAMAVAMIGCAGDQALEVRPFHLRDLTVVTDEDPMIRGEQRRRLYGAVGVREQEQRLGHYYTVLWQDDSGGAPARLVFEYQQGSSGSRVLRQEREFDAERQQGKAEFRVIGDDYFDGGRVLAWRCSLYRGERLVATRRSYLWQ